MEFELFVVGVVVLCAIGYGIAYGTSADYTEITVDEKITKYHDGEEKYLIHTEQGEVFEITDTIMFARWDSSDVYFSLEEGKTYRCKVAGWRIPVLSWYRNIITYKEIQE